MNVAIRFTIASMVALLIATSASADDQTRDLYFQTAIDRYFNSPTTARNFGMEGSNSLTAMDSSGVTGNPAGIGLMEKGEVSGTYRYDTISGDEFPTDRSIEQRENSGSVFAAIPLGPLRDELPEYGNLGLGWSGNYANWDDDSFDTHAEQQNVTAAYAKSISEDLSLGYSLTWTRDKLQSNDIFDYPMANGFRHAFGGIFVIDPDTKVGATLIAGHGTHHALYGPGIDGESDTTQFGGALGFEQNFDDTLFAASIDYSYLETNGDVEESIPANFVGGDEEGHLFNVRLGVEQSIGENFFARVGYRFAGLANYMYDRGELGELEGSAYYNAVSLGAGANFDTGWHYLPQLKLDYGVEYRAVGDDDWQHVVTLTAPFDICDPV